MKLLVGSVNLIPQDVAEDMNILISEVDEECIFSSSNVVVMCITESVTLVDTVSRIITMEQW